MSASDQNRESIMKEYEKTQDMIKHYDDITMRFGTMTQSGVLIFVGLTFGLLSQEKKMFIHLFPFVILFIILINIMVHMWFKRHRSISQIKIHRILEIERELGWKQFSLVDEAIKSNRVESQPVRRMILIYHVSLPVILGIAYFVILYSGRN